jgi:transcriptional regulator with XRE-family HTH domain
MSAPRPIAPLTLADEARFWAKVSKGEECWEWRGTTHKDGYAQFMVAGAWYPAHRVSYTLALGPIPDGLLVCHKCDVRRCVRPDHFFLGTDADNARDKVEKGRQQRGEAVHLAKLTEADVVKARGMVAAGMSRTDVAGLLGVSREAVTFAVAGKHWKHVPIPAEVAAGIAGNSGMPRGSRQWLAKLTESAVAEIKGRLAAGESQRSIGARFGVASGTISDIANGRTWKHVQAEERRVA